jgi:hypothetical protein
MTLLAIIGGLTAVYLLIKLLAWMANIWHEVYHRSDPDDTDNEGV